MNFIETQPPVYTIISNNYNSRGFLFYSYAPIIFMTVLVPSLLLTNIIIIIVIIIIIIMTIILIIVITMIVVVLIIKY